MTDPAPAVVLALAAAFDRGDEDAVVALLADDATAEVLGSGFPVERGPEDIRAKSVRHMLAAGDAGPPRVHALAHAGASWLVWTEGPAAEVSCAARVAARDGRVVRVEYLVPHLRGGDVAAVATAWRAQASARA